ncbi:MAG: hypothetical protein LBC98_05680 [Prevotellaceae bacterium]|nr:hypothetical protein [Prevotellaceae bacterium]
MNKLQVFRSFRIFAIAASIVLMLASCASSKSRTHYPMKKKLNCGK